MLVAVAAESDAATFYVAPTRCDDGNAGTVEMSPWCTIEKANGTLAAGDTVLIKAGTYTQQIRPNTNGTSDTARITYQAYGDGNVILTAVGDTSGGHTGSGAIALGGKSFVSVLGYGSTGGMPQLIQAKPGRTAFSALGNVIGSVGCIVDSVLFDGSTESAGQNEVFLFGNLYDARVSPDTQYNVLRKSKLLGKGNVQNPRIEDIIHVAGNAHHNLIDGNDIENCWHLPINVGAVKGVQPQHNVIRGNVIKNPWHSGLSFYQGGATHNLVEGNTISSTGGAPSPPGGVGNTFQGTPTDHIIRYNVLIKGGSTNNTDNSIGGVSMATQAGIGISGNRIYNNTIAKNSGYAIGFYFFSGGTIISKNVLVNNIFYGSDRASKTGVLLDRWDSKVTGNRYIRNLYGNPDGSSAQAVIQNRTTGTGYTVDGAARLSNPNYSAWNRFSNTYNARPGFVNYTRDDYHLTAGSVAIDAGAYLTQVASRDAGTGTSLTVDDARFFWDASGFPSWMDVQGDTIAIGTVTNTVQVTAVNLSKNTLTLASAIGRRVGAPIWLVKDTAGITRLHGTAPDLGAFESGRTGPTAMPR